MTSESLQSPDFKGQKIPPKSPKSRILTLVLAISVLPALAARADDIVGQASVIDGDTIEVHGQRIRLWGIDAPESDQLCRNDDSKLYQCGRAAATALAGLLWAIKRPVTCSPVDRDQYGRTIAACSLGTPGPDIGHCLSRTAMRSIGRDTPKANMRTRSAAQRRPTVGSGLEASPSRGNTALA
ncbi:thermonuclease family protein [Bradyrhizobium sp. CB82]|uniref:thermonuclease family protein n=1 Tax=Bradyrhizobium sp. CB82 TaxID=3039159 RepID=UPI0032C20F8C